MSKMRRVSAGTVMVLATATVLAQARDRVIGLLALPEVFGTGACDRFTPEEISVRAAPGSDRVLGLVRLDRPWTYHAAGGCEGLRVTVQAPGGQDVGELPTKEHAYEAPAAIVLERRDEWFRIRLDAGTGWVRASDRDEYFPLEDLLADGLTYLSDAAETRLADAPGLEPPRSQPGTLGLGRSVRVVESRTLNGELWLRLEVLSHSPCDSDEEPRVVSRGWMPAHDASGEPTVWFYSRGC